MQPELLLKLLIQNYYSVQLVYICVTWIYGKPVYIYIYIYIFVCVQNTNTLLLASLLA